MEAHAILEAMEIDGATKLVLTTAEVMTVLGVSESTVFRWQAAGILRIWSGTN